jgi:hypothetical protein
MTIPGTLDYAALALNASTLAPWEPKPNGSLTAHGYTITRQGDHTAYYTAYAPGGVAQSNELGAGAGAGSHGLAKCVRYCERHASKGDDQAPVLIATAETAPAPSSNSVSSNNKPQSSLF